MISFACLHRLLRVLIRLRASPWVGVINTFLVLLSVNNARATSRATNVNQQPGAVVLLSSLSRDGYDRWRVLVVAVVAGPVP